MKDKLTPTSSAGSRLVISERLTTALTGAPWALTKGGLPSCSMGRCIATAHAQESRMIVSNINLLLLCKIGEKWIKKGFYKPESRPF